MRYLPHTDEDIKEMLAAAGATAVSDLFSSVPDGARLKKALNLPAAMSEMELVRHIQLIGEKNIPATRCISFLGAGSYQHFIPSALKEIAARSEWLTPYTPYQPEISQGTLQAIFEYQTMICFLTGMDVSNASHYDGATATAEAALMAVQKAKKNEVIVAKTLHPEYRDTIKTMLRPRGTKILEMPFEANGQIDVCALKEAACADTACIIVQSPNFFGVIEELDKIAKVASENETIFTVAITEPVSLGILEGPGKLGADIVTAEGQAFGCGLNYGGPYLGIFAAREEFLRAMPGRIVGATADKDGRRGFVLTIATREQHIRREKATSNICSNEALMALNATIYLSLLGKNGLKRLAEINLANACYLKNGLKKISGVQIAFDGPTFNEFVIKVAKDAEKINRNLSDKNIFGGVNLGHWYPGLKDHVLVCTTECHTREDLDIFVDAMKKEME